MGDEVEGENRYEIQPSYEKRFNSYLVKKLTEDIVEEFFASNPYQVNNGDILAQALARKLRDSLIKSDSRYKLAVNVYLGERKDQKVVLLCKNFWDTWVDNYVTYNHFGDKYFCSIIISAFYLD